MRTTNIINLGSVRDLLPEWMKVRNHITTEKVSGWYAVFRDEDGQETAFVGGVYKDNTSLATAALLKLSAARMLLEDDPLEPLEPLKASNE